MEDRWIELAHARVGDVRIREDAVIHFAGLPGFPNARRFALVREEGDGVFQWLACLDDSELAFVVTDPLLFFPDYAPVLPQPQLRALGAGRREEVVLLAIANFAGDAPRLNLAAPLLVHLETRRAAQTVLDDPQLSIAEPLPIHQKESGDRKVVIDRDEKKDRDAEAGPASSEPPAQAQIESKPQT